jgi:hypothetical protein
MAIVKPAPEPVGAYSATAISGQLAANYEQIRQDFDTGFTVFSTVCSRSFNLPFAI